MNNSIDMQQQDAVKLALAAFRANRLVAFPTETVYGLAAPTHQPELIRRVFELKERPLFNPLIVHIAGQYQVPEYASDWPEAARKLADAFWPGPLTLVVTRHPELNPLITSGRDTVGLRCPRHPLTLELIRRLGSGLVGPSANKSGRTSPTCADHVRSSFPEEEVHILDGGPCEVGIESTVVAVSNRKLRLLRPGVITPALLEQVAELKCDTSLQTGSNPQVVEAPGQLEAHYRPAMPLVVSQLPAGEIDWAYLKSQYKLNRDEFELRQLDPEPVLAARNLYALLHQPLAPGRKAQLLLLPDDRQGAWDAIHNRLRRATTCWLEADTTADSS